MHLAGWVGVLAMGGFCSPPATDIFSYREYFWVTSKEKEKGFCPKEKGGNRGFFSHVKKPRDSGNPLCPWVRGLVGGLPPWEGSPLQIKTLHPTSGWTEESEPLTGFPGLSLIVRETAYAICQRVGMERTLPDS